MRICTCLFVLTVLLHTAPLALQAQSTSNVQGVGQRESTRSNIAAYYYYAERGDLTMQVNVWGTVRYPGRYEVQVGANLGELISYAGGPQLRLRREQEERKITVRVSRWVENGRQIVYEHPLDSLVVSADHYPSLKDGDVVTVETVEREGFSWRDVVSIVGSSASVGLLVVRALLISR